MHQAAAAKKPKTTKPVGVPKVKKAAAPRKQLLPRRPLPKLPWCIYYFASASVDNPVFINTTNPTLPPTIHESRLLLCCWHRLLSNPSHVMSPQARSRICRCVHLNACRVYTPPTLDKPPPPSPLFQYRAPPPPLFCPSPSSLAQIFSSACSAYMCMPPPSPPHMHDVGMLLPVREGRDPPVLRCCWPAAQRRPGVEVVVCWS